jgi:outer membrane protein TolC
MKDPLLQGLVREAVAKNQDVAVAAARVEQARGAAKVSRSAIYPQVGYAAGAGHAQDARVVVSSGGLRSDAHGLEAPPAPLPAPAR